MSTDEPDKQKVSRKSPRLVAKGGRHGVQVAGGGSSTYDDGQYPPGKAYEGVWNLVAQKVASPLVKHIFRQCI